MESNTLLALLKKASEDEGLRNELVALAGRHGIQLGSDELSDVALDQVSGGDLDPFRTGRVDPFETGNVDPFQTGFGKLQPTLLAPDTTMKPLTPQGPLLKGRGR